MTPEECIALLQTIARQALAIARLEARLTELESQASKEAGEK